MTLDLGRFHVKYGKLMEVVGAKVHGVKGAKVHGRIPGKDPRGVYQGIKVGELKMHLRLTVMGLIGAEKLDEIELVVGSGAWAEMEAKWSQWICSERGQEVSRECKALVPGWSSLSDWEWEQEFKRMCFSLWL
jgi:hypothetical protein